MGKYVDGFIIPLMKDNVDEYRRMAQKISAIWKEHGALEYCECIGDDLGVKDQTPFSFAVKAEPCETVIFGWIVFRSREHRDEVNQAVMNDPRITKEINIDAKPFDSMRTVCGGFKMIIDV